MTDLRRRRAFTLVEVIVSLGISVTALTAITSMLIYSSRVMQSNLAQLHAGEASRRFYNSVAEAARTAMHIVVANDGLSVTLTQADNTVQSFTFVDEDSNLETIVNNRIFFDPDTSTGGDEESIVNGVTPGPLGWIFRPNTPRPLLDISFRIGDPSNNPASPSHVFTGPGTQGVDVTSQITPRNLHLWGG